MTHLQLAQKLCTMIGEGKLFEAVDELYDDNVEIIEGNGDSFKGKETQKGRITEWQSSLDGFHGGGVTSITANEDQGVTMVESWTEITPKGAPGPIRFEEVAVQNWKDGKIVKERFYFDASGMGG